MHVPSRFSSSEYSLKGYGDMIADTVRMHAYREALAWAIKPGATVLDLGAGTGIMSLLACRLGAAKVFAVEPGHALAVGVELAHVNGYADRIEFLNKSSLQVELPQRADVLVSDLRGVLPLHSTHIRSIVDARQRLLASQGVMIPNSDAVRVQLVSDALLHAQPLKVWREGALGLDLSPALRWAAHQIRKAEFSGSRLVGTPQTAFRIDYTTVVSTNAGGEVHWICDEEATVHGMAVWFDTMLADGIGFSNAPDKPRAIYGQMFFPFESSLELRPGDRTTVRLAATLVSDEYVWQWNTRVTGPGGEQKAGLRQSSFQSRPLSPARLGPRADASVPDLTPEGVAAADALALMKQHLSPGDIGARLVSRHPGLYAANPERAHELVADLSEWFTQRP